MKLNDIMMDGQHSVTNPMVTHLLVRRRPVPFRVRSKGNYRVKAAGHFCTRFVKFTVVAHFTRSLYTACVSFGPFSLKAKNTQNDSLVTGHCTACMCARWTTGGAVVPCGRNWVTWPNWLMRERAHSFSCHHFSLFSLLFF